MTAATRSSRRKVPPRVACPVPGCTYTMDNTGSVPAHLAMSHPEVPMDEIAPRRVLGVAGQIEPTHGPDCPDGLHVHVFTPAAPEALPLASGTATTDPESRSPLDGSADAGEAARDAVPAGMGLPEAAIAPPSPAPALAEPTFRHETGQLPIDSIHVAENVRDDVGDVTELAASIRAYGLLQPISVQQVAGRWIVVTGHRRLRACRLAGLARVYVQFLPADQAGEKAGHRREVQLVENRQRVGLNALEEAKAFRAILDGERGLAGAPGLTQKALAERQGIAPATLSNILRLLDAEPQVQELLRVGSISEAHVKAIVGLPAEEQVRQAERGAAGTSAHQLEDNAKYYREQEAARKKRTKGNATAISTAIATLGDAGVPPGTEVVVVVAYDLDKVGVLDAVSEAGWTPVEGWGAEADGCGCTTLKLDVRTTGGTISGICLDDAHRDARVAAHDAKRQEREQQAELERQLLYGALETALARVSPTLLRLVARYQDNYNGKTWTEYGKLDNAALVRDVAHRLANSHGSKPVPVEKVVEALRAEAAS